MAFDHTNLPDIPRFCDPYCYPPINPAGICPILCVKVCLNTCKTIFPQITLPPDVSSPPPPPSSPPDSHYKISLALIIAASILAAALFFLTCYTLYKLYSCWRRPIRIRAMATSYASDRTHFVDVDLGPVIDNPIWYIRTVGLQPSVINSIPVVKYSKGDGLIEGTDCSVCLTEFEEDETLRLLPKCSHAFHLPCIDTWLISHTNCPLCRAAIVDSNTARIPSQELIVDNSVIVEVNPVETEGSEVRLGIEDHQIGISFGDSVRRSVSMDSLSASRVRNGDLAEEKVVSKRVGINQSLLRLVGSSSIERCMQTGSSSVKRSVSCSAKVFQETIKLG